MGYIPPEWANTLNSAHAWHNTDKMKWHDAWVRALNNMPTNSRGNGQPAALGILLGYPIRRVGGGGQYSIHNRIFTNLGRGSKPRDPVKAEKLERLAAPDGKLVAWMTLCKMGYGRKYQI